MIAAILWLGLYPQPVLNTTSPALHHLEQTAADKQIAVRLPSQAIVLSEIDGHSPAPPAWPKGGNP
jgi:hypothetical protein